MENKLELEDGSWKLEDRRQKTENVGAGFTSARQTEPGKPASVDTRFMASEKPKTQNRRTQLVDIHEYYDKTRFDYRYVWGSRKHLAVHFGYYDASAKVHPEALDNMNRVLADLAGIKAGEKVLDAGCGMGNSCFWLAENRKAEVTGISIVQSQIDDCNRIATERNVADIAFLKADFCNTPFENGTFDVVWGCESVCHARDKKDFYREAFRILKPGGRLVMAEYMRTERPVTKRGETLLQQWLLPWSITDIDTKEEHREKAEAAGFRNVQISDVTANVRVSLRNLYEICKKAYWPGTILNFIGIINDTRYNNGLGSIRLYEALQEGAWFYAHVVAGKPKE